MSADLLLSREQRCGFPTVFLWTLPLRTADDHTWAEADVVCLWKLLGISPAQAARRDRGHKVLSCNLSISVT